MSDKTTKPSDCETGDCHNCAHRFYVYPRLCNHPTLEDEQTYASPGKENEQCPGWELQDWDLLRAAPDMLTALRVFVCAADLEAKMGNPLHPAWENILRPARAAIRKAEGR